VIKTKKYWDKIKRTKEVTVWRHQLTKEELVVQKSYLGGWSIYYGKPFGYADSPDVKQMGYAKTRWEAEEIVTDWLKRR